MDNIAPVRALNRRSTQLLQLGFVVLAVGIFLFIVGIALVTILLVPPNHALYNLYNLGGNLLWIIGAILVLVGIGMAIRALTRRKENDIARLTGDHLARFLNGHYSFIRNINRPGLGYIDAVIIGPPGALVLRIVDTEGRLANEAASWLRQRGPDEWVSLGFSPTREAVADVQSLRQYLAKNGMENIPVFGHIVFVRPPDRVQIAEKNPVVPISHLHTLYDNLRQDYLSKEERVPQQVVTAARRLLLEG